MGLLSRISGHFARFHGDIVGGVMLAKAGATLPSILLYPIRRRLPGARTQIDLGHGVSITGPADEPLLFLFREIWVDRRYDLGDLPHPLDGVVVDIGAHVGLFSVWIARHFPGSRILAVEPSPRAATYLRRNAGSLPGADITAVEAACGATPGRSFLHLGRSEMTNSMYAERGGSSHTGSEAGGATSGRKAPGGSGMGGSDLEVEVITLDELFARFAIERCALLKLDCEGAEYDILGGASADTLSRIERVVMEYHRGVDGHDPRELVEGLERGGFTVRTADSVSDPIHGYLYARRSAPSSLDASRTQDVPTEAGLAR